MNTTIMASRCIAQPGKRNRCVYPGRRDGRLARRIPEVNLPPVCRVLRELSASRWSLQPGVTAQPETGHTGHHTPNRGGVCHARHRCLPGIWPDMTDHHGGGADIKPDIGGFEPLMSAGHMQFGAYGRCLAALTMGMAVLLGFWVFVLCLDLKTAALRSFARSCLLNPSKIPA